MKTVRAAIAAVAATMALLVPSGAAFAAPPPCQPGAPGCKTGDDPDKNNPKFIETQRGNLNAPGTESTCVGTNPGGRTKPC